LIPEGRGEAVLEGCVEGIEFFGTADRNRKEGMVTTEEMM
jgi:hypothetical protein